MEKFIQNGKEKVLPIGHSKYHKHKHKQITVGNHWYFKVQLNSETNSIKELNLLQSTTHLTTLMKLTVQQITKL